MTPARDDDDEVAVREGGSGRQLRRHRQGDGERHRAPEPGGRRDHPLAGADPPRPLGLPTVDDPDQVGRRVEPRPARPDHDHGDDDDVEDGARHRGAREVADRRLGLQTDEEEQRAAEHGGGQRPEAEHQLPGGRTGDAGCRLAHQQAAHDDREHPGGVHQVGEQERRERRDQHGHVLEGGVVDPAADPRAQQADEATGQDATSVRDDEQPADRSEPQLLLTDGHGDRDAEDHESGAVVDEALRPQHGDDAPRQGAGEHADGGGVGRRERGAQDPRRTPAHPQQVVGGRRHRARGRRDEHRADQYHDAQVATDLAQGGREALPVEQRRQEHQQNHLGRQLHLAQAGHEPQQGADRQQGDRRGDGQLLGQGATQHQGDAHDDDQLECEHAALLHHGTRRGILDDRIMTEIP